MSELYNIPSYDTDRMSYGPGVLYIGAPGVTATQDVGAIRSGVEFVVRRETMEVWQGNPRTHVKTYVLHESCELIITGIEWNTDIISKAIGTGSTTSTDDLETFEMGGDPNVQRISLRFQHITPEGLTITIDMVQSFPGEQFVAIYDDDLHEFAYRWEGNVFKAIRELPGEAPTGQTIFILELFGDAYVYEGVVKDKLDYNELVADPYVYVGVVTSAITSPEFLSDVDITYPYS
jgi:hypothetical protein